MRSENDNLVRFVRRVHRRFILVRAAERAGACLGVASGFACLFAALALFQGRDAMQLVLPTLAAGALVGIIWGFSRRPSAFDAVVEADRQLQLADLLASAYAQRHGADPWQRAVVALADERCRSLSPAAVMVHRYGGRAWGGIGLSAALGLTLALLSGVPQDSRARPADVRRASTATEAAEESPEMQAMAAGSSAASPSPQSAAGAAESRAGMAADANAADAADASAASAS